MPIETNYLLLPDNVYVAIKNKTKQIHRYIVKISFFYSNNLNQVGNEIKLVSITRTIVHYVKTYKKSSKFNRKKRCNKKKKRMQHNIPNGNCKHSLTYET